MRKSVEKSRKEKHDGARGGRAPISSERPTRLSLRRITNQSHATDVQACVALCVSHAYIYAALLATPSTMMGVISKRARKRKSEEITAVRFEGITLIHSEKKNN